MEFLTKDPLLRHKGLFFTVNRVFLFSDPCHLITVVIYTCTASQISGIHLHLLNFMLEKRL